MNKKDEVSKPVRRARWMVIITNVVFIAAIFGTLVYRSDPLSRYPYGTPAQRQIMAERFSNADIDILINSQIYPEQILPFIDAPGFDINNTLYYDIAARTQRANPEFVVQFVNKYRDRFDAASLQEMLSWMPYSNLIEYFDMNISMPLAQNPSAIDYYLDPATTLYTWRPTDLVQAEENISLRSSAAQAWSRMKQAAAKDGVTLRPISGFVSYEMQNKMTDYPSMPLAPYGSREEQLGLTLYLDGYDLWNQTLSGMPEGEWDFLKAIGTLNDQQRAARDWLEANASDYGFVLRYGQGKEAQTGVLYQPFVIRYVTPEIAGSLKEKDLSLEEYVKEGDKDGN